jgi:hypothetical protein
MMTGACLEDYTFVRKALPIRPAQSGTGQSSGTGLKSRHWLRAGSRCLCCERNGITCRIKLMSERQLKTKLNSNSKQDRLQNESSSRAMRALKFIIVILALQVSWCCHAQVYSVAAYAGGTSYRQICSFTFPFFPYRYALTERNWYADANGLTIIDVGHEKERGGILHIALDVECGSESFTIPFEPLPSRHAEVTTPNTRIGYRDVSRF